MAFAFVFGLTLSASVQATTLGDVAAAIAAPAGAAQSTNEWASFSKLKGVKWKGSAPAKGGNTYYWSGDTTIDGLGRGGIGTSGSKTTVMNATVNTTKLVDRNSCHRCSPPVPKDTQLELIRGACPGEGTSASRIYRVTLAGRKPLYMHVQMQVDDRSGNFTSFEMEPQRNKGWTC